MAVATAVADTFDRADSASLGTASDGVHSWNVDQGSFGISSNQADLLTSTAILSYSTVDAGAGDVAIQVDVPTYWGTANNGGWGIAFRFTDPGNNYVADFGTVSPGLYKLVGGVSTLLVALSATMLSGDTIMVEALGSAITCKHLRSGTLTTLATDTDTTYDNTHHKHGLFAFGSDTISRFDNFIVSVRTPPKLAVVQSAALTRAANW